MRTISFHNESFDDYNTWAKENPKVFERIVRIIKETARNPFDGIGKPELLKKNLKGFWSRRINDEHRLVYQVKENEIIIVSCRYHY